MIRFTAKQLDGMLAEFLGKPHRRFATGPDAYDCYGLVKSFMGRIGVEIADIGAVDPKDSRPVYERQQEGYIRLDWPRPWSLVTFSSEDLRAHIGAVLPNDDLFLHCPGRAAGKVIAEPLSRRPWRDSVDGYWWPKGYIEAVIMLTPMSTTKRAWQFVKAGRSLAEIIVQDIAGEVPVQAFLNGQEIKPEEWADTIPTEHQQLVIRPIMGEGRQAAMIGGMLALAVFAPMAAGALLGGTPTATAAAVATGSPGALAAVGSVSAFAYNLTTAAVMMGGGLALNALVGPEEAKQEPSQAYQLNPSTLQKVGALVPLVYGTFGVRGLVLCSYMASQATVESGTWSKGQNVITAGRDLVYSKIAYSDGPIDGIVTNTEVLNGRDPNFYSGASGFTIEHFNGTDDQAASTVPDYFEIPVNQRLLYNTAVTKTFTAVQCDRAAVVVRFDNYFMYLAKDGDRSPATVGVKIEVRQSGGAWHTLVMDDLRAKIPYGIRLVFYFNQTYDGGSPFTLTAGTSYEVRVTRTTEWHTGNEWMYFDCIQCGFATAQKHPGLAYTVIGAAGSEHLTGQIDYYAKIKGKLVCIYDSSGAVTSIEWSDNPAWIAVDLLTRPVIKGNGDTVPYAVEYYRKLDPSYLVMADFITFADWCDVLVDDGDGGTEKRYTFNGVFDQDGSAWGQAIRVCKSACATPYFRGHRIGIVVDKPTTPTQMFNVANLRSGFSETWIDTTEAATVFDCEFANEQADYALEPYPVPLLGATKDIPASMDCFGLTKRSRVWRRAARQLRINQHMKWTVEIPATLDAIYTSLGDVVYAQHPALQRATGGRIVEVYEDGVKLDKPVWMLRPVAYYRMDDNAASTVVRDSSGYGNHGAAQQNTSALHTAGKLGGALTFNGSSDYVTCGNGASINFGTSDFSCFAWIKTSYTGDNQRIICKRGGPSNVDGFDFYVQGSNGYLGLLVGDGVVVGSTTYTVRSWNPPVNLRDGNWHFVGFTVDRDGNSYFYADGTVSSAVSYTDHQGSIDVAYNMTIGVYNVTPNTAEFTGSLDNVAMFNRALTQAELDALYNNGSGKDILPESDDHALLIRTHDGTGEYLSLYEVATVTGDNLDIVTISGVWEYTPEVNDLWTFGEQTKVIDLYRVKGFERTGDGQVFIQGSQYTTDFYTDDEEPPRIEAKVYSETKGGLSPALLPTSAEAVAASRIDPSSTIDTMTWEGLVFTGDAVDTVTWECSGVDGSGPGDGIKYKGYWCPIIDDAVGTTKRWIYFDPNIGDPRYLQATDDIDDLIGHERYVFCENVAGVAHFKPGVLLTEADRKLDGIEEGATVGAVWNGNIQGQPVGYLIDWQGTLASAPATPQEGWAYRNSTDGNSYIWDGSAWQQMTADGIDGVNGADGVDGTDGTSIVWRGTFASHPGSPQNGWAYYNSTDKKSYVYQSGTWYQMTIDGVDGANGVDGADGLSIVWHGDAASPDPSWEVLNHCYRDTDNGYVYIYNGSAWELMVMDGSDGANGADGTDGLSLFVTYHDNAADTPPATPTGDGTTGGWHTNATSAVVWISQKVAADALSGTWGTPVRISGTAVWSEIIDDGGKPADGADVTAHSNLAAGLFRETFEDPNNDVASRWVYLSNHSIQAGGLAGGKFLRVGDNSGNDMSWAVYGHSIPYDPSKLYRLRCRIRQTAGTGATYFGFCGRDAADTVYVNRAGINELTNAHYRSVAMTADWTVVTFYYKGHAAAGVSGDPPGLDPANPGKAHADVRYVRPCLLFNFNVQPGTVEVDEVTLDILPEDADQIPESATKKWAGETGADVTGSHTSADTSAVGGTAAATVRDNAASGASAWSKFSGAGNTLPSGNVEFNFAGSSSKGGNATNTDNVGTQTAATVQAATVNFNNRNDRNAAAITAPTIAGDATAVDHTLSTDGTANVSLEWSWGGSNADIDGWIVYVRQSTSAAAYTMGTTAAEEQVYYVTPEKRAFLLYGLPANQYYTFGVQAYRIVDADVNANGVIKSAIAQPSLAAENPYRPSATVAFAGNLTGTINGSAPGALATLNQANTAQIVDNAVSQGPSAYTAGSVACDSTERTMQSVAITTEGGVVFVQFSGVHISGSLCTYTVKLYRTATEVYSATGIVNGGFGTFINISFSEQPAAGSYTYYAKIQKSANNDGAVYNRSMYVQELKK